MTHAVARAPHVVRVPKAFFVLRIIQLVVAVILMALLAFLTWGYNVVYAGYGGAWISGLGAGLFCCILTLALSIYYLVTTTRAPKGYNLWALISLEATAVLFWLVTFALMAETASYFALYTYTGSSYVSSSSTSTGSTYYCSSGVCCDAAGNCYNQKRSILEKRTSVPVYPAIFYTALGLAAVEWILSIVTMVLFSIGIHRHRKAGMPAAVHSQHSDPYYSNNHMEAAGQPMQPMQPMPGQETAPAYQELHQNQGPHSGFVQQPMH